MASCTFTTPVGFSIKSNLSHTNFQNSSYRGLEGKEDIFNQTSKQLIFYRATLLARELTVGFPHWFGMLLLLCKRIFLCPFFGRFQFSPRHWWRSFHTCTLSNNGSELPSWGPGRPVLKNRTQLVLLIKE